MIFDLKQGEKYDEEFINRQQTEINQLKAEIERLTNEIDNRDKKFIGYCNEIQSLKEEIEEIKSEPSLRKFAEFRINHCNKTFCRLCKHDDYCPVRFIKSDDFVNNFKKVIAIAKEAKTNERV